MSIISTWSSSDELRVAASLAIPASSELISMAWAELETSAALVRVVLEEDGAVGSCFTRVARFDLGMTGRATTATATAAGIAEGTSAGIAAGTTAAIAAAW